jgi:hypothetical protein
MSTIAEIFHRDGARSRRRRVLKRYVEKPLIASIEMDIYAGVQPDLAQKAKDRLEAKSIVIKAMYSVIPFYIEAGGDIKSFQYDIVDMLVDKEGIGTIAERAYWGRMATDVWRSREEAERAD